ncbi:kelch-like protein 23 isoform X2 [Pyrgilauda ruficollis]|uniref:kelch-like protein 23 isoform X2 n=1 Tax=Pyrgilauda ruficollis TaxID=221976 RepID=UPI001B873CA1|nr:kelch-like protein 23 isoform X2 [Pyrgilauda ruficollis]
MGEPLELAALPSIAPPSALGARGAAARGGFRSLTAAAEAPRFVVWLSDTELVTLPRHLLLSLTRPGLLSPPQTAFNPCPGVGSACTAAAAVRAGPFRGERVRGGGGGGGHQNRSCRCGPAAPSGSGSSKDGQGPPRAGSPRKRRAGRVRSRRAAGLCGAARTKRRELRGAAMAAAGQEEYAYLYKDSAHPAGFLEAFRAFYLDGLFTDIALQCASGVIFHCHRAALAACSSYFKAMFTADMKEKSKNQISLPGLSHAVLEALVNYAYTSQIQITKRNVQSLLQAADLLQFVSVKKACEQFLVRHLDTDNCIGMHSFAEYHDCSELEKESRRILLWQFEEVWKQEEFLDIGKEKLSYILSRENLNVKKEEAAIEAVIKWVAHNVEGRIEDICEVLSCIKLDLDNVYLRSALSLQKKCRLNDSKIRSLIYNALNLNPKGLSRRSTAAMYVIGGYYWHPLSEVHVWDPLTNAWVQGTEMPDHTRESYGVTSLGPDIYVTGGYRTESIEALDTVWIYNSERDEWTEGCPMLDARYYHCAVSLSGCIYALGGYRKGAPVQEAEFYDPLIQKWLPIANMIKGVGNATACVLHEVIYVAGGHYGYRGSCTYDKIQRYHSGSNEWSIVTTSPHPDHNH